MFKKKITLAIYILAIISCSDNATDYFEKGKSKFNLIGTAEIWNQEKEYEEAVKYFSKAIRLNPNFAEAYYYRALSTPWSHENALKDFNKAINLNPDRIEFYHARATYFIFKEKFKNALKDYSKIIDISPKNPLGYCLRAYYFTTIVPYAASSEAPLSRVNIPDVFYEKGIKDYSLAIEYNKDFFSDENNDHKLCYVFEEFPYDYVDPNPLGPNTGIILDLFYNPYCSSNAYVSRGYAYKKIGDYELALKDFDKHYELLNKFGCDTKNIISTIFHTKVSMKDYTGAMKDVNELINLDPEYHQYYGYRGEIKFKLKDYMGSIDDYSLAIDKYADWKLNEAFLYDKRIIRESYEKVFLSDYYRKRGLAKTKINKVDSACSDFSKAGELGDKDIYKTIQKYCN